MQSSRRGHRALLVGIAATSITVAGALGIVSAQSAAAATRTINVTCTGDVPVSASPGDTLVIQLNGGCTYAPARWELYNVNVAGNESGFLGPIISTTCAQYPPGPYANNWYVRQDPGGSCTVTTTMLGADGFGNPLSVGGDIALLDAFGDPARYHLTYGGPVATTVEESGPAPWYQAYGRLAASDACRTNWHPSYAMWMNQGKGGYTCDSTLAYDSASGSWVNR